MPPERKKTIEVTVFIAVIVVVALLALLAIYLVRKGTKFEFKKAPRRQPTLIESTTAPVSGVPPVPEEVEQSLTAPGQKKPVPPKVIRSLTAPSR